MVGRRLRCVRRHCAGRPHHADITGATHIFAIGCALPAAAVSSGKSKDWADVPDDKGYEAQRDAIVKHVKELLDDLQRRGR